MLKVLNLNLIPDSFSFGKYLLKINKIVYVEKIDSILYKTNLNLGVVQTPTYTEEGAQYFMPKEEVYQLDSLYRCIVDTGVIIDKDFEIFDYSVENHPKVVALKGLAVLSPVKIFNGDGITTLGVCIVNLSSIKIPITKYMPFALLALREKKLISIEFSHE